MLQSVQISNIALIEDVEIQFQPGLNIISGETGAGKSIILNSLYLILGEQARAELIRTGKENARVHAVFDISDYPELKAYLSDEAGIPTEDSLLIIDREIDSQKGSSAFINNRRVLLQTLKNVGNYLIDIHGQHQNQSLFDKSNHLRLLDKYAGIENWIQEYRSGFHQAIQLNRELKEKLKLEEEKEKMEQFNRFALEEIEKADLKESEEETLDSELKRLSHFEEIRNSLEEAYEWIYHGETCALTLLQKGQGILDKLKTREPEVKKVLPFLQDSLLKLEPVIDFLKNYRHEIDFSPERMQEISKRLEIIRGLKSKYGKSLEEIFSYRDQIKKELLDIEQNQDAIEKLESSIDGIREELAKKALAISERRKEAAGKLEKAIEEELHFLGMEKAKLMVSFEFLEDPEGKVVASDGKRFKLSRDGIEKVEFLISPNLGEEPRPLAKIASGGELSRMMLSIKNILRKIDPILVLIFDEVDTGIGGKTAFAVGAKLKEISKDKQTVCITHLPQIASMGESHYKVEKIEENQRTKTVIHILSEDERIQEISRMLSGDQLTEISLEHARQFLNRQRES